MEIRFDHPAAGLTIQCDFMDHTRVKICGITSPEDGAAASAAGADAIGLNFLGGPRRIDLATAAAILEALPPMVSAVALVELPWPSALPDLFTRGRGHGPIRHLQIYGDLKNIDFSASPLRTIQLWPVASVAARSDVMKLSNQVRAWGLIASAVVLDTFNGRQRGGTGTVFNWNWIAEARANGALQGVPPLILAGGLNPDNVGAAIRIARPWAVDVSSGVEFPDQPGRKDPARMRAFIDAVRQAGAGAK